MAREEVSGLDVADPDEIVAAAFRIRQVVAVDENDGDAAFREDVESGLGRLGRAGNEVYGLHYNAGARARL